MNHRKREWDAAWLPSVLLTITIIGLVLLVVSISAGMFFAATGEGLGW